MKTPYLLNLLTAPWAVMPEVLVQLQDIYAARMRAEKVDLSAVESQLGRPLSNEPPRYDLRPGGVAVLSADGVMAPKANVFMQVSGGISTQMLTQQFNALRADTRVKAVVFAPSSPGGNVVGVPEAARALAALAAEKPTVTVAEGPLASAMYWVGSAANAVYVHGETDPVGSLGVYARLGWEKADPHSYEMVRGKYKRISVNGQAPDPDVIAHHEGQMDYLYSLLVDTVAQQRRVKAEQVLEHMAEGRVFYGQQALAGGLVDGVSTVDAMAEQLATNPAPFAGRRKAVFALGGGHAPEASAGDALAEGTPEPEGAGDAHEGDPPTDPKGHPMPQGTETPQVSRESLERDHGSLFAQLRTEFMAAGAAAELTRVKAVMAEGQGMKGHEALVLALALDGKTSGAEAAQAILAAQRNEHNAHAAAHANDAPPAAPAAPAPKDVPGKTRADLAAEATAYAAQHKVGFVDACKALGITH